MKRFLLICLTAMFAVASWAYEFSEDGFYYNVVSTDEMTCEVTSGDNAYAGDIVIPSTADGYTVVSIGSNAFSNCTGVTSLIVPNTVTSVGFSAFAGCTSLATVTFQEGEIALSFVTDGLFDGPFKDCPVTTLYVGRQYSSTNGSYPAFKTVSALEKLTLGQYVTELELCAFHDCSKLMELVIEDATTTLFFNTAYWDGDDEYYDGEPDEYIETEPFNKCPLATVYMGRNLDYTSNTAQTSFHSPFYTEVVNETLSSITFGQNVTEIPMNLLRGCSSVKELDLHEGITSIGTSAFQDTGITELKLKDTLTSLGGSSFSRCTSLLTVDTGSGLTSLESSTFDNCSKLQTVTLGENMASLGSYAFRNCTALVSVTSLNHNPPSCNSNTFNSVTTSNVILYVPEGTMEDYSIASVWSDFDIQEIVEEKTQFDVDGIYYKVIDPDSDVKEVEVTYGGETAESGTETYTGDITIPATVNDNNTPYTVIGIGDNAFRNCKGLASVTIAEENITYIGENAFRESGIKTVSLGAVKTIKQYAFSESGLTNLTLPDNVTTIEPHAFHGCMSMTSLTLGKGLTYIDECVFDSIGITSLVIPDNIEEIGSYGFNRCMRMKSLEIGSGLKTIGEYAFCWSGLEELTIPSTVSTIGQYAFSDNLSLVKVNVDAETINTYAFTGSTMKELNIGDNVKTIGRRAFYYCTDLVSVYIPGTVDITAVSIFQECPSLEKVELGEGMTTCGSSTFMYCRKLTDVTLPETFATLPVSMFNECAMTSISLPASVETIGSGALRGVPLEEIYSYNPVPSTIDYEHDFDDVYDSCVLYVPCDYVETYATTSYWSNFVNIQGIDCPEETGTFTCVVSPESGSDVAELYNNITFYNPTEGGAIYVNDYCEEVIEVYSEDETLVTWQAQFYTEFDPDGEDYSQTVYFEDRVSDEGTYYVNVPAELFIIHDENGKTCHNEAMTITYTITADSGDQEPNYELVFNPEDGSTLDVLSAISIYCEDGITQVLMPDEEITITDAENNTWSGNYTITEVANDLGIVTEVVITLSPEIVEAGTYYVNVPSGYFDINQRMNEAFTLTYTITGTYAGIGGISINDENVESIYSVGGQKLNTTVKGVNIIHMADGAVKKILIK